MFHDVLLVVNAVGGIEGLFFLAGPYCDLCDPEIGW